MKNNNGEQSKGEEFEREREEGPESGGFCTNTVCSVSSFRTVAPEVFLFYYVFSTVAGFTAVRALFAATVLV